LIAEQHVVALEWLGEPDAELGSNPGSLGDTRPGDGARLIGGMVDR
jgi:hypothetical protein